MRIGMIGLDTSHVVEFTRIFQEDPDNELKGITISAGYPGGSDLPLSRDRVATYTDQLRSMGVQIVNDLAELVASVDGVMLESVDGTQHLQQAIAVIESGKPLFIDKPLAGSTADAREIQRRVDQQQLPCFSSSCIRFSRPLAALREGRLGEIVGAETWGPCHSQSKVPELFFYGIHGIEGLFSLMGGGCRRVQRTCTATADVIVGVWDQGRVGTYRGLRTGEAGFGATAFGTLGIESCDIGVPYRDLCIQIARFFTSGEAPVSLDETIEILAFMEAADASKQRGGVPVEIERIP